MLLRLVAFMAGALASIASNPSSAKVFSVNKAGPVDPSDCARVDPDVDDCWFGDALVQANSTPEPDSIVFALDSTGFSGQSVPCATAPPGVWQVDIAHPLVIDGFTQEVPGLPPNTPPVALTTGLFVHSTADGTVREASTATAARSSPSAPATQRPAGT